MNILNSSNKDMPIESSRFQCLVEETKRYWKARRNPSSFDGPNKLPPELRYLNQILLSSFITSSLIGALIGGRLAGLRYTAENAHALVNQTSRYAPQRSQSQWFLYFRRKYHQIILQSLKSAFKTGIKLTGVCGLLVGGEVALELGRDQVDIWNGIGGGILTGAGFLAAFPRNLPKRTKVQIFMLSTSAGALLSAAQYLESRMRFENRSANDLVQTPNANASANNKHQTQFLWTWKSKYEPFLKDYY